MSAFTDIGADLSFNDGLFEFDSSDIVVTTPEIAGNLYTKKYDDTTTEYYRVLRTTKLDPFFNINLQDDKSFKFYQQWDPYTGDRIKDDPYGPLVFCPDGLIKYFYSNRLNNLWVDESDEADGFFEGRYDMAVGTGKTISIIGRGDCPDKYLFRIPIQDCYLTNEHKQVFITMGPMLTDAEITEIDRLANLNENNYFQQFGKKRPSLQLIKQYYDQAIDKTIGEIANRKAVDKLRKL
jgi:hypothetical protein